MLLGVYAKVHDPTGETISTFGLGSMIRMKVILGSVVAVLALGQLVGALWLYGKLGVKAPPWLGTAHRLSGLLAVIVSLPVAFHCLWSLGFQSYDTRVLVHSVVGCVVYGAVVIKVMAVRSHGAPGWFLPVAGGLLFTALILVTLTSAGWFVSEFGWPGAGEQY